MYFNTTVEKEKKLSKFIPNFSQNTEFAKDFMVSNQPRTFEGIGSLITNKELNRFSWVKFFGKTSKLALHFVIKSLIVILLAVEKAQITATNKVS
jgi:hypothetical protein